MDAAGDFLAYYRDGEFQQLMLLACPDGVVVTDPGERIVLYTGAAEEIFGFEPVEVLGKDISVLFGAREPDRELRERMAREGTVANMEVRALRKEKGPFWAAVSASQLKDSFGTLLGTVLYVRDHTALREIQRALKDNNEKLESLVSRLNHVAAHDGLTGLLNRASALDASRKALDALVEAGRPLGVVIMDVDHFKSINDSHGHLAGDLVLTRLGEVMRAHARSSDILGRFGGEEFVAFLPGASLGDAQRFAERVRREIAKTTIAIGDGEVAVTISAGVASLPGCAATLEGALRRADARLYAAKGLGRDRVVAGDSPSERSAA